MGAVGSGGLPASRCRSRSRRERAAFCATRRELNLAHSTWTVRSHKADAGETLPRVRIPPSPRLPPRCSTKRDTGTRRCSAASRPARRRPPPESVLAASPLRAAGGGSRSAGRDVPAECAWPLSYSRTPSAKRALDVFLLSLASCVGIGPSFARGASRHDRRLALITSGACHEACAWVAALGPTPAQEAQSCWIGKADNFVCKQLGSSSALGRTAASHHLRLRGSTQLEAGVARTRCDTGHTGRRLPLSRIGFGRLSVTRRSVLDETAESADLGPRFESASLDLG